MPSPVSRRRFGFGEFELIPEERSLRRNGQEVELAAKAFDALVVLVLHAPSVVTKEELIAALWPDTIVADGNLNTQIWTVRQALGEGRWVETVPKRGYQVRRQTGGEQYHYLKYQQPVGEHAKYLVWAQGRPIACLAWSSAPRHLGSRDRYIGWSAELSMGGWRAPEMQHWKPEMIAWLQKTLNVKERR